MKTALFVGIVVGGLSGCASIASLSEYEVAIASTPDAARFTVVDKAGAQVHSGVTPDTVTLKSSSGYFRKEVYTITFKKDGFPERTFTMRSTLDGWYFGNFVFGGLLGFLVIDPYTGAMYRLPERVDVALDESVTMNQEESITIASIETLSPEERRQLVKIN
ncbi:MAG: hypothetical protein AAFV47_07515 [Pseudomonadota bacterium]